MFPGFRIDGHGVFRVLRDSDIEVEEDAEDLVRYYRTAIQRRRRGSVILLQLQGDFDPAAEQLLRNQLGLDQAMVIKTGGLIGIAGLAAIVEEDRPDLKFEPYSPRYPERIREHDGDCFAAIREKDIIIHHPYESFEVVVDFLRQAASDPDVVAIKQTLYRAGKQSAVIAALIAAAEAGKSVTAVVELKARFDEEQNLLWASRARARRRAGDLWLRRLEDPRQGLDGRAPRGRWLSHLLPLRHRQLSPGDRAHLYRPQLLHRRSQGRPRCRAAVQLHHRLCRAAAHRNAGDLAARPARTAL